MAKDGSAKRDALVPNFSYRNLLSITSSPRISPRWSPASTPGTSTPPTTRFRPARDAAQTPNVSQQRQRSRQASRELPLSRVRHPSPFES